MKVILNTYRYTDKKEDWFNTMTNESNQFMNILEEIISRDLLEPLQAITDRISDLETKIKKNEAF